MKKRYTAMFVVAALVAGVVAGSAMTGVAAPAKDPTARAVQGCGLALGGAMREAGGRLSDIVAKLTGLEAAEVRAKRQAGDSLADIAESKGVSSDEVVDEALKIRKEVLDANVESGAITQEQADAAYERMQSRLSDRVSSTGVGCNGRGMGGGRGAGFGGRGCGAGGCGQAPAVTQ